MSTGHGAAGESAWTPTSEFSRRVAAIAQIAGGWVGYFVTTVMCRMDGDWPEGDLLLGLLDTSAGVRYMPVWLHLADIRYLCMDDAREAEGRWADEIRVSWLQARRSWTVETRPRKLRSWPGEGGTADLECEMARVEIVGPWNMEVIAQIIDISVTPPELENVSSLL